MRIRLIMLLTLTSVFSLSCANDESKMVPQAYESKAAILVHTNLTGLEGMDSSWRHQCNDDEKGFLMDDKDAVCVVFSKEGYRRGHVTRYQDSWLCMHKNDAAYVTCFDGDLNQVLPKQTVNGMCAFTGLTPSCKNLENAAAMEKVREISKGEICGDYLDNNGNGAIDEGCDCSPESPYNPLLRHITPEMDCGQGCLANGVMSGCTHPPYTTTQAMRECLNNSPCHIGDMRRCGKSDVGTCRLGTQICGQGYNGCNWGLCTGDIEPTPETCNGLDDDCDGLVDNNFSPSCGKAEAVNKVYDDMTAGKTFWNEATKPSFDQMSFWDKAKLPGYCDPCFAH